MAHRYFPSGFEAGWSLISTLPFRSRRRRFSQQAGNYVREEILSAFIRLVVHTPELQAYSASRLYTALRADISQEALTLSATWILGEYSEVLIEGGLVDEEQATAVWRMALFLTASNGSVGHRRRNHRPHPLHPRLTIC